MLERSNNLRHFSVYSVGINPMMSSGEPCQRDDPALDTQPVSDRHIMRVSPKRLERNGKVTAVLRGTFFDLGLTVLVPTIR